METSEMRARVFIYAGIAIVAITIIGALLLIGDSIRIGYMVSGGVAALGLLIMGYCWVEYKEEERGIF